MSRFAFSMIMLGGLTLVTLGCGERFSAPDAATGAGGAGGDGTTVTKGSSSTTTASSSSGMGGGEECVRTGPEICNGLDDDCNGSVDEGCPAGIVLEGGTYQGHELYNAEGNTNFNNMCPMGSAIFQIRVLVNVNFTPPAINTIAADCATVAMAEDTNTTPYSYYVVRGQQTELQDNGGGVGQSFTLTCPGESFMIGLSGFADFNPNIGLQQSWIHCAELEIAQNEDGFYLEHGQTSIEGTIGPQNYDDILDEPELVTRYRGFAENWVHLIGIGHGTPSLLLK